MIKVREEFKHLSIGAIFIRHFPEVIRECLQYALEVKDDSDVYLYASEIEPIWNCFTNPEGNTSNSAADDGGAKDQALEKPQGSTLLFPGTRVMFEDSGSEHQGCIKSIHHFSAPAVPLPVGSEHIEAGCCRT